MGFLLIIFFMKNFNFIDKQKSYFQSGKTRDINSRIEVLDKLYLSISKNELRIFEALKKDLNKSNFETY